MSEDFATIIIPRMVLKIPFVRVQKVTPDNLTLMERKVFEQLVTGKSRKEISSAMNLTVRTISFHAGNIYRKAKVQDRIQFLAIYGTPPEAPQP